MASVRIMAFNDAGDMVDSIDLIDGASEVDVWRVFDRVKNLVRKNSEAIHQGVTSGDGDPLLVNALLTDTDPSDSLRVRIRV